MAPRCPTSPPALPQCPPGLWSRPIPRRPICCRCTRVCTCAGSHRHPLATTPFKKRTSPLLNQKILKKQSSKIFKNAFCFLLLLCLLLARSVVRAPALRGPRPATSNQYFRRKNLNIVSFFALFGNWRCVCCSPQLFVFFFAFFRDLCLSRNPRPPFPTHINTHRLTQTKAPEFSKLSFYNPSFNPL